jgi:hypothetical protein
MKKTVKRVICSLLALLLVCGLAACGGTKSVDPKTCTYDEMVDYLTAKGYISKDAAPVDMLTTEGYITDNTGGDIPYAPFADKAQDYDGLWLMWWDSATPSEAYTNCFQNLAMNEGTIVYMGGAAVLETAAYNGNFAIAFGEGYAQKDAVTADFQALSQK